MDGRGGNDTLYGGDGDDVLEGGDGADRLHGGKGSDTFIITYSEDTNNNPQTDTVFGEGMDLNDDGTTSTVTADPDDRDTISYVEWDNDTDTGVTLNLGSSSDVTGIENIIGSQHNDVLTGDGGDNVIEGGVGDDNLTGGGEGTGGDTVSYRGSADGVTVELGGTVEDGDAAGDTLSGFENIIGSRRGDILTGDGGDNVIEGLAGGDTLDGGTHGAGGDTLSYQSSSSGVQVNLNQGELENGTRLIERSTGGHAQGDKVTYLSFENIIGSRHVDTLTGDNRANTLRGGDGGDTLYGDDDNDMLFGGPGNDRLYGDDEDDTLTGGAGADRLDGGDNTNTGQDIASYAGAPAGVTLDLDAGRGRAGEADGDTFFNLEKYVGSSHDDTFIASDDPDDIDGGTHAGDDMGDTDGVDGDTVSYEKSTDGVSVNLGTTTYTGGYAEGDTLTGIENVTGSPDRDTLIGDGNANVLTGGAGNDDLTGGGGNDVFTFAGRHGSDDITDFTQGEDRIDLSAFRNIASVKDFEEYIDPGTNTEIDLSTFGGGDIELESFNHSTNPLTDDDFIFYSTTRNGSSGSNTLTGDAGRDIINGGAGDDRLFGNAGKDILNGDAGDDTIYGGEDKDRLNGGAGNDVLDGGPGADIFVFTPGSGNDYIMDFNTEGGAANADMIDLTAFDSVSTSDTTTGDGNHVIELPDGGTITVLGVGDGALDSGDFIT